MFTIYFERRERERGRRIREENEKREGECVCVCKRIKSCKIINKIIHFEKITNV